MSNKHTSGGSANWGLSSLWRPLSQHSFAQSMDTSTQDGFAPHWSLAIPSFFFGRQSDSSAGDSNSLKATAALLPFDQGSRHFSQHRSDTGETEEPNRYRLARSSLPSTRDGQEEAFNRLVRMKTTSRSSMRKARLMPSLPSLRPEHDYPARRSCRASSHTKYSKRSLRRTSITIAELPALPMSPPLKASRAATMEGTTVAASERLGSRPPVPPKPGHDSVEDIDPHLVLWDGPRDSGKAMNWSPGRKWLSTVVQGAVVFCVTFASTITGPASNRIASEFGAPSEIMVLDTLLFVLGIAVGSMIIWSPLNDMYGRQLPQYIGFFSFTVLQIPVAVADNLATVFVCRFFAGLAGGAPLITVVSSITDLWSPLDRGIAMSIFASALTIGPAAGPLVGGFVSNSETLGWRWTSWIILIASIFFGICCWLFHAETSAHVLLRRRAKQLRYTTKDWALHAPVDEVELNLRVLIDCHVWKPLVMLFTEPMLLLVTVYMAFTFGLLYLFTEAFPLSYVDQRHWDVETAGLPFIPIIVGVLIGCIINWVFTVRRQAPLVRKYGRLCPEERLLPFMLGSISLPVGIFIYAWTAMPDITPIPQIAAGVTLGIGFLLIILQGTNYLLDVYTLHASAAVAVNTTVLSAMAAAFTGFARCMFRNMSTHWAGTLLGVVSIVLIVIPLILVKLGIKIRAMSSFTKKLQSGSDSSRCSPVQGSPEEKV